MQSNSEFWTPPTAHQEFWERHNCAEVYQYDPTDDGPECEQLTRILATHPELTRDDEYRLILLTLDSMENIFAYELFRRRMVAKGLL
jgi:hypothetical protein